MSYSAPGVSMAAGTSVQGVPSIPPAQQAADVGRLQLLAATPAGGFALQNGTPTILQVTVPDDGQFHRVFCFARLVVATLEVGGALAFGSVVASQQLFAGALAVGTYMNMLGGLHQGSASRGYAIGQTSALTGGAATLFAEIWGS